jgi:hypothetical protein
MLRSSSILRSDKLPAHHPLLTEILTATSQLSVSWCHEKYEERESKQRNEEGTKEKAKDKRNIVQLLKKALRS